MLCILRFSVDGEQDGQLRNRLAKILTDAGFVLNPNVTATYENGAIAQDRLALTMLAFWDQANNPPNDAMLTTFGRMPTTRQMPPDHRVELTTDSRDRDQTYPMVLALRGRPRE